MTALEGNLPVALLPVRLETRFLQSPTRLLVRVYPDTIHVLKHADGLTEAERAEGEAYWRARFAKDPQAEAIWRQIVAAHHAPRAMWIVRALQPTNIAQLGQAGVQPAFPTDLEAITTFAKQPFATLLPDRLCAIGYARRADGTRREVFRVWGTNVPDVLPMAPSFDPASATPADTEFFGGDRKWIVDFPTAVAQGMGIADHAGACERPPRAVAGRDAVYARDTARPLGGGRGGLDAWPRRGRRRGRRCA